MSLVNRPLVHIQQINTPLTRCRVVEAERLGFDTQLLVSAGDVEFFKVRVAIEDFMVVRDAVILNPDIGIVQAIGQAPHVGLPVADEKVEIVRAVALRKVCRIRGGLRSQWNTENRHEHEHKTLEPTGLHEGLPFLDAKMQATALAVFWTGTAQIRYQFPAGWPRFPSRSEAGR